MMHIGCSHTQRHATTVIAKEAREIQVGDVMLSATADEANAFTGSDREIGIMLMRDANTVTEVREREPRTVIQRGKYGHFTNVPRRTKLLVAVCR